MRLFHFCLIGRNSKEIGLPNLGDNFRLSNTNLLILPVTITAITQDTDCLGYDIHGLVYKKPKGEIKKSIIFFTILAVLVVGQITSAVAAIINFDDYSTGPLTFASSTRYQPLGAVFSRDIPIYSVAAVEADWWVEKFQAGGACA